MLFTRKYKEIPITELKLFEKKKKVSKEGNYLGVVCDSNLNWNKHLK